MATYMMMTLVVFLMALISSATPTNFPSKNQQDLSIAIEEMQRANHFTFVMLINMSPLDQRILGNVTFLMPNDRMLSKTSIPENSVSEFLFRHSIPTPLLFEHLDHIPTGSVIPSSLPDYMLKISNGGRRSFLLNNVKIISPNICTAGSSIRCHGIDGVLEATKLAENNTSPLPSCSNNSSSPVIASPVPPTLPPSLATPPLTDSDQTPGFALPPSDPGYPQKSGSSQWPSNGRLLKLLVTFFFFW